MRDMILWFATPEVRSELIYVMLTEPDNPMMDDLELACRDKIATWVPTSELQYSYYRARRQVEWLVWSTVNQLDETMVAAYVLEDETNGDSPLEPWGIEISPLPHYHGLPASPRVPVDDSVQPIDWNERHN